MNEWNERYVSLSLLEDCIKSLKGKVDKSDDDNLLLSHYEREYELLRHVTITGVNKYGCSIEEFKQKLEDRPNVLLLSDDEVQKMNKALEIMKIL